MPASSPVEATRWKLPLGDANNDVRRMTSSRLIPLLILRGAARAIDFYVDTLGAEVLTRFEHGSNRHVSHADLALGGAVLSLTEELRAWNSDAPESLGGSPVVLQLEVSDARATVAAMTEAGAALVFPLAEFLGERMARVRDPFGHLWIVRETIERLSRDEIARRREELFESFAVPTPNTDRQLAALEDTSTLSGATRTPQARNASRDAAACVHLVVGPVGAGKSTFARRLAAGERALRLTLDEWMSALFGPDRPETGRREWYVERRERCLELIWVVAKAAAEAGSDVVLEPGLLRRTERESFYGRVEQAGLRLKLYALDASRDVRRARVMQRNDARGETFSMLVPLEFFELASDLWEPLEPDECDGRDVTIRRTDE
jgi:uncharacterized glyoxalase superfamily protein PhnB/predicted kinase